MTMRRRSTMAPTCIAAAFALLLTACAGDQSGSGIQTSDGQVQNTTETAPADLQLTCSSAAASRFGIPPDKILPTASSKLPDATYEVRLTTEGQNFLCKVDNNANIISIAPV